jgi:hypothetical protein
MKRSELRDSAQFMTVLMICCWCCGVVFAAWWAAGVTNDLPARWALVPACIAFVTFFSLRRARRQLVQAIELQDAGQ